jgi:hypothetical protein
MNGTELPRAVPWDPHQSITAPCADISFVYEAGRGASLAATMHFSRLHDGLPNDLELLFLHPVALQWEQESFGLIDLPELLPLIGGVGPYASMAAFPLLLIEGSPWANDYAARVLTDQEFERHTLKHFALISLNDLLHVLSWDLPAARFVE